MKWVVESYFAPDERSKGEWKTLRAFDRKEEAELFAKDMEARDALWTSYHVRRKREKIAITKEERHFIDLMDAAFRSAYIDKAAVDRILSGAAEALERELRKAERRRYI